jgi:hypothetical protein
MKARVQNFYKRWNIEYKEEEKIESFKNRIISTIDEVLGRSFLEDEQLLRKYFRLIGALLALSQTGFASVVQALYVPIYGKSFEGSPVYKLFLDERRFEKIIFYVQALFWIDIKTNTKQVLYEKVKEDIELSLLDIKIKKTKIGECIFYPAGAKLLDEGVVNDALDWLTPYSESYKSFESALKKYQEHKYERNLIDDLRLSLELLLKVILKNKKSLDNQKESLGRYLKGKDAPKEIRNMFTTLTAYYVDYQNEYAKHDDKVREAEIEFMIYLTGTFMRFILSLVSGFKK